MNNKLILALVLITVGVVSRLVPHPPNLTAVGAVAIFAGVYLPRKYALVVPVLAMVIADMVVGFHATAGWVYGGFATVSLLSLGLRQHFQGTKVIAFPLVSALVFYLVSNFGVWVAGSLYPLTAAGLLESYLRALPFLRPTLAGDLLYTAAIYGTLELVRDWQGQKQYNHALA